MASSSEKVDVQANNDTLDALLARVLASASHGDDPDSTEILPKQHPSKLRSTKIDNLVGKDQPWKLLSDQVNDEISRQIFDDLDKQLEAQMMAELEKCQEEQSRRMDEELDRQIQEQLDAMLEASLGSEFREDEHDECEYYSEDEYSSDEEEHELEKLPWSEGGEGGIGSLGLGERPAKDGMGRSGKVFGAPTYTQDELQQMVDSLYGEEVWDKQTGPGAWGKASWRPKGDA